MKSIQLIALSLLIAVIIMSCNSPSGSVVTKSVSSPKALTTAGVVPSLNMSTNTGSAPVSKGTIDNLNAAKKAGKAVFLVVTGTGVPETDKAMLIAKGANDIYKNAVIVQMSRDDSANTQLVNQYRLAGAPLPLILVISSGGIPTGGYLLAQATAQNLADLIPSPKLEDIYSTIASSKIALVVFTKDSFKERAEVLKVCKEAVAKLDNNAEIVEVDLEDAKEVKLMNLLRVDKASNATLTMVINKQGQVTGTATSIPDATKLATAATLVVKSSCCGPGSNPASCGK